jgi:hypothetical protein
MEVMYEERKVLIYDLMKFEIAQVKFDINRWWNLRNITS